MNVDNHLPIINSCLVIEKFLQETVSSQISSFQESMETVLGTMKDNLRYELEKQIRELIKYPNQFENIEPKEFIFFLENKLKKKPSDFDGWMLLARTCYISGYFQKADLYYNRALKYFPKNEII